MKKIIFLTMLCVTALSFGQIVNIPNANFKNALLNHDPVIDTNGDGEIQISEAAAFTGVMDVSLKNISDLTGIEAFTALTELRCNNNSLTSLDVSNNTALTKLYVYQNWVLTSLNISNNTALTYLDCSATQLTNLDVSNNTALIELNSNHNFLTNLDVSNNLALETLWVWSNQLTSLDVSNNTALEVLVCSENQLTSLDVSNNTALTFLSCYDNQLTSLDVSKNTALIELQCLNNQLTSLDVSNNLDLEILLVLNNQLTSLDLSANIALTELNCGDNQLTSLDVSNNTALIELWCHNNLLTNLDVSSNITLNRLWGHDNQLINLDMSNNTALSNVRFDNNQLTSLNIANGNNTSLSNFRVHNNPDLTCIQADENIINNIPDHWLYDEGVEFSNNCAIYIPDPNFKNALLNHDPVIDTNGDGEIQNSEAADFTGVIDVSGSSSGFRSTITDLTGIKAFSNATGLRANGNDLISVDLKGNTALTEIRLEDNQLRNLSIANGNNANLTVFNITNNPDLACVEVDENMVGNIPAGWQYDAGVTFNVTCALAIEEFTTAKVVMYPNPANGVVTILSENTIENVTVFNLHGRQVISQSGNTFDVSELKAGVYLVRIATENGVSVQKLVVG